MMKLFIFTPLAVSDPSNAVYRFSYIFTIKFSIFKTL